VLHVCNLSTHESEARDFEFEVSLGYMGRLLFKNQETVTADVVFT
jgi:hypothetical protein